MTKKAWVLFFIGVLSQTQIRVVGWIGISELCMILAGPFLLYKYGRDMRRDGLAPFLVFAFLWVFGAVITDLYRGTLLNDMLRGVASPLSVCFMTSSLYLLLHDDVRRIKWAVLGFAVTRILCIYVLPMGSSYGVAEASGLTAIEAAEEYKLAISSIVTGIAIIIPVFWYLKCPYLSSAVIMAVAVYNLYVGGRGAFMTALISAGLLFLPGGNVRRLKTIHRGFPILAVVSVLGIVGAKMGYEYAVTHGYMGEEEFKKYEQQKNSRIGLLSGRSEFVASFMAIKDSPILGHGSWALDFKGYGLWAAEWLEDDRAITGYANSPFIRWIPTHSHIHCAYVWHGVLGYLFWVYALYVIYKTVRQHFGDVPEVYAYLVVMLPLTVWNIFFSPFGTRVATTAVLVVCLLLCNRKALLIRKGWKPYLPHSQS